MATEQRAWWARWTWRHPEWWTFALSLGAWVALLAPVDGSGTFSVFHLHHQRGLNGMFSPWRGEVFWWMIMVIAMMLPLTVHCVRITATRSIWGRRNRAILLFLLGYLAIWTATGMVACAAIVNLGAQRWFRPATASVATFGLAALWQITAAKRRALRSCHRTIPLAPHGWRANADCIYYGWLIGGNCLVSCGVLMVACSLSGHSFAVMAGTGLIGGIERYGLRPNHRLLSALIASLGIISIFLLSH